MIAQVNEDTIAAYARSAPLERVKWAIETLSGLVRRETREQERANWQAALNVWQAEIERRKVST